MKQVLWHKFVLVPVIRRNPPNRPIPITRKWVAFNSVRYMRESPNQNYLDGQRKELNLVNKILAERKEMLNLAHSYQSLRHEVQAHIKTEILKQMRNLKMNSETKIVTPTRVTRPLTDVFPNEWSN